MDKIKLRHFDLFTNNISSYKILQEVYGFKQMSKVKQLIFFRRVSKEAVIVLQELQGIEFSELQEETVNEFTLPSDIDLISFGARLEIDQLLPSLDNSSRQYSEAVARLITITLYQEVYKEPFKEGFKFSILKHKILNLPLLKAIGLSNSILKKLGDSREEWRSRFAQDTTSDPDYLSAGGSRLDRFNTLQVLSYGCKIFNRNEEEVWDLSYVMVQSILWNSQIENDVQSRMAKIKERRIKAQSKVK